MPQWRWVAGRVRRPRLTGIWPKLLVGEYPTPDDVAWLKDTHGVTAVLCLQDDADLASKGLDERELAVRCAREGLIWQRCPIGDGDTSALAARLEDILVRLHGLVNADHTVYVHCSGGMNRAPSVVIAYLHVYRGFSIAAARQFVQQRHHCVPYMQVLDELYGKR